MSSQRGKPLIKQMIYFATCCLIDFNEVTDSYNPSIQTGRSDSCPLNTYIVFDHRGVETCEKCSRCSTGFQVSQKCTIYNDTVCEPCSSGWYNKRKGGHCTPCSDCEPGQYMKRACTSKRDTACRKCPRHTFTLFSNSIRCFPCKRCQLNEKEISSCNRTTDTTCGECENGYFRASATDACLPCSECPKAYSHLVVPECREKMGVAHPYICLPGHSYKYTSDKTDDVIVEVQTNNEKPAEQYDAHLRVLVSLLGIVLTISVTVVVIITAWVKVKEKCCACSLPGLARTNLEVVDSFIWATADDELLDVTHLKHSLNSQDSFEYIHNKRGKSLFSFGTWTFAEMAQSSPEVTGYQKGHVTSIQKKKTINSSGTSTM